ncbi:HigA family addiction module antitoxin [Castellaniella caeni]
MGALNCPHPGVVLRECVVQALRLSDSEAAEKLGVSCSSLSRVVSGKASIGPDLAAGLEAAGISTARFWLALQREYDQSRFGSDRSR